MKTILKAARFAAEKHIGQRRKNAAAGPYINHPIEVADCLADLGGVEDEAILAAALLHDTVEDTDATEADIEIAFGPEVAGLVMECTDDKRLDKAERKRLQVLNAPKKSAGAKMIKTADKLCNLRSILSDPPQGWTRERQYEYFLWAARVLAGLKGANDALDRAADEVLAEGREKLGPL